ncbi:uncharacterized protein LOC142027956 [Buteo buteo]|uniref:uncharacterized protein LOC142027956 n=1 Tax=Buteo buteo TaxID=30397 RepID=UPI003EB9DFBC
MQKVIGWLGGCVPRVPPATFQGGVPPEGGEALGALPPPARQFVEEGVRLCRPRALHLCDGSPAEGAALLSQLQADGVVLHPLPKYDNCWLARTDPRDVARVESRTVLVTERERDAIPPQTPGARVGGHHHWSTIVKRRPSSLVGRHRSVAIVSRCPPGVGGHHLRLTITGACHAPFGQPPCWPMAVDHGPAPLPHLLPLTNELVLLADPFVDQLVPPPPLDQRIPLADALVGC